MGQEEYVAERVWLTSYFDYCDEMEVSVEAQDAMAIEGVTLAEILHVFRSPEVVFSDRSHDGCDFAVKGRNCDDETITVSGRFHSETYRVSVFDVTRS